MRDNDPRRQLAVARERLRQIEQDREQSSGHDLDPNRELRTEESELRARLVKLQDSTLKEYDTQEIPGVPGAPAVAGTK